MNRPILTATSVSVLPTIATTLEGASAPEQDLAGITAFERIALAAATPTSIPSHTPDWTNLRHADPGLSQNDIDNGNLVAEVGVATIKPAEFVVLSVSHKSASG